MKKGEYKHNRIGEKYITKEGYTIEIIEYNGPVDCTVKFENGLILTKRRITHIKSGAIRNPYHPSIHGVGYIGIGDYLTGKDGVMTRSYKTWSGMIKRCYSNKYQIEKPSYIGCSVDESWHNFQNYAKWHEENYIEGFTLDKDILLKGNKIYSENTCLFVPNEINSLFRRHKHGSKRKINERADKWKDRIHPKVYEAMINYEM